VEIVSGVRHGKTLGSPVALVVKNDDWKHWTNVMGIEPIEETDEVKRQLTRPRPGHADLNGGMKYGHRDLRNVLERSSARETTVRVAVGAVAKQLLSELGVKIVSHVTEIGGIKVDPTSYIGKSADEIRAIVEEDAVYCADSSKTKEMTDLIDATKKNGDSIGGTVEVIVEGMPAGIGSYVHYDRKLDAKIAASVMSINAFKGVEFGLGFEMARRPGSEVHDEIIWSEEAGYTRSTNNLGGFEGGMTTGMPIIVRGVMKPIPTLYKPLKSVDIETKEPFQASIERSDSCAVPAASIVAEHVVAFEAANALLEQFDADQLPRLKENIESYKAYTKEF